MHGCVYFVSIRHAHKHRRRRKAPCTRLVSDPHMYTGRLEHVTADFCHIPPDPAATACPNTLADASTRTCGARPDAASAKSCASAKRAHAASRAYTSRPPRTTRGDTRTPSDRNCIAMHGAGERNSEIGGEKTIANSCGPVVWVAFLDALIAE